MSLGIGADRDRSYRDLSGVAKHDGSRIVPKVPVAASAQRATEGESRGHGGLLYEWIGLPLIVGGIYADKDRQEAIVKASGLNWTIFRPTRSSQMARAPVSTGF